MRYKRILILFIGLVIFYLNAFMQIYSFTPGTSFHILTVNITVKDSIRVGRSRDGRIFDNMINGSNNNGTNGLTLIPGGITR